MIGFKRHLEKYGNTYADWDTASRSDAQQLFTSITNFEFIIVFLTVYQYLSHLAGITVKLQKQALDILEAHQQIADISRVYKLERQNVDSGFAKFLNMLVESQIKLVAQLKCLELLQDNSIAVMLQPFLPVNISREMLRSRFLITSSRL